MAGARGDGAALLRGNASAKLLQQELAEQRVIVIRDLLTAAPIREQVMAVQVLEHPRRLVAPAKRGGFGTGDRRRNRTEHQHALVLRPRAVEDLAREILKDRVLALAEGVVERCAAPAKMLPQQHERRHPPVAFALNAQKLLRGDRLAAEDGLRLVLRAAKRRSVDARNTPARHEAREFGRRIGARYHDDRNALGHLFQSWRESRALSGGGVGVVEVVEDDDARRRQCGEEIAKEAANEAG